VNDQAWMAYVLLLLVGIAFFAWRACVELWEIRKLLARLLLLSGARDEEEPEEKEKALTGWAWFSDKMSMVAGFAVMGVIIWAGVRWVVVPVIDWLFHVAGH
jgi:hypothetical protein